MWIKTANRRNLLVGKRIRWKKVHNEETNLEIPREWQSALISRDKIKTTVRSEIGDIYGVEMPLNADLMLPECNVIRSNALRWNYTPTSSVTMSKYRRHKFRISERARYKSWIRTEQVVRGTWETSSRWTRVGERKIRSRARSLDVGQERHDGKKRFE